MIAAFGKSSPMECAAAIAFGGRILANPPAPADAEKKTPCPPGRRPDPSHRDDLLNSTPQQQAAKRHDQVH